MTQISATVSNGAMAQPTQCIPWSSNTRAARGSLARSAATVSSRVAHVRHETHWCSPDSCSIVDHGRSEVFVMAQRAPGTRGALRGRQVFSDSDERVRLQQDDALTATAEDAAFLP